MSESASSIDASETRQPDYVGQRAGRVLTHSLLLARRITLHSRIRTLAALLLIIGALAARTLLDLVALDVRALVHIGLGILAYNFLITRLIHREAPEGAQASAVRRANERTLFLAGALDFFSLSLVIFFLGGARSPFMPFYVLHVVVACLLLSRPAAIALTGLAFAQVVLLLIGEVSGFLPAPTHGAGIGCTETFGADEATIIGAVYLVLFTITLFLFTSLAALMRSGEQQIRESFAEAERMAALRRDFLRVATHNIRSPIGAATMLLRNLLSGHGGGLNEQQAQWTERALKRLDGLQKFLEETARVVTLESGRVSQQLAPIAVGPLILSLAEQYGDLLSERSQTLELEIAEDLPEIHGIPHLLREALANYITNAHKYTQEGGRITVRARPADGEVHIEVQDNGRGISEADQATVFEEFVRVGDPGAPEVGPMGTGLGLAIVRRIIQAHGGRVSVRSVVGVGSTFAMDLPVLALPHEGR